MTQMGALRTSWLVKMTEVTNRSWVVPVVIFQPTSRCNSRCISCDWWRSGGGDDLSVAEVERIAGELPHLGTRLVVFSGGEPLLRPEVFDMAALFQQHRMELHLLTSGVLLDRCVDRVATTFTRVIVSLDAATESEYRAVRGVNALAAVERGIARLRRVAPHVPVTARATLHRRNFHLLHALVEHARALALDAISFLAADVQSLAFGRDEPADPSRLALSADEIGELRHLIQRLITEHADDFDTGFIADTPERLRRLPQYFAALIGQGTHPVQSCNAPWMSLVIEANGAVRPCFFHASLGNVRSRTLAEIVGQDLPAFRARLDVATNPVCRRCVCSIRTGFRSAPWS